jgi:hypothetical protein
MSFFFLHKNKSQKTPVRSLPDVPGPHVYQSEVRTLLLEFTPKSVGSQVLYQSKKPMDIKFLVLYLAVDTDKRVYRYLVFDPEIPSFQGNPCMHDCPSALLTYYTYIDDFQRRNTVTNDHE